MKPVIELRNIKKIYKDGYKTSTMAVEKFSAAFEKGKFYALMGASGAGKSTILSIMGFMDRCTEGEVYLDGEKVENLTKNQMADIRMKKLGFVFQHYFLNPKLTVRENLILPMKINKSIQKSEYEEKVDTILTYFSIEGYKNKYPNQLSGGEQQRVCIARALANDPEIILADEPTGNLDEYNEKIVMEYLRKLTQDSKTVIMVTHSSNVKDYADKVIYMEKGRIKNEGI